MSPPDASDIGAKPQRSQRGIVADSALSEQQVDELRVRRWPTILEFIYLYGITGVLSVVLYAARSQLISVVWGAYLGLISAMLGLSFLFFVRSMQKDDRLSIESNWGGLGGGLGGWRVSSALTFLLISAALFGALIAGLQAAARPDLRERYRAAINLGEREGIRFDKRQVVGGKLRLTVKAPSPTAYDAFWNQVKLANSAYDDILVDVTFEVPAASRPADSGSPKSSPAPPTPAPSGSDQKK